MRERRKNRRGREREGKHFFCESDNKLGEEKNTQAYTQHPLESTTAESEGGHSFARERNREREEKVFSLL